MAKAGNLEAFIAMYEEEIMKDHHGRAIRIKNVGQKYIDAVKTHDVIFGVGPAGTGKPFSRGDGSSSFKKAKYKNYFNSSSGGSWRKLGLLPGDLKEKVDPYLRPVYDALYQIFGMDHTNRLMERGVIEIAPLAYMRGRTLDDAFVILDEAQNTTVAQMKMF